MKKLKTVFIFFLPVLLLAGCMRPQEDFNPAVIRFDDSTHGTRAYFIYPAVLSVLNFNHDSTFAAVIKDVRKMKIVTANNDSLTRAHADTLMHNIRKAHFSNLMEVYRDSTRISLLLKKSNGIPDHFIAVSYGADKIIAIELLGKVPLKDIPALLNKNMSFGGLETIINSKSGKRKSKKKNGKHSRNQ